MSHFSYAPLFQGPHFWTKMMELNILYDNLLIDILSVWWHRKKKIGITHANHSATSKTILTKMQKCTCNLNVYIFYLRFALGINHGDRCDRKSTQNNDFIQVKPLFLVAEFSNTVTFWRNARFDVILTSVTIIRQIFLRKLFCYESLVDIEVSNTKKAFHWHVL